MDSWEQEIINIIRSDDYDKGEVRHNETTLKVCKYIRGLLVSRVELPVKHEKPDLETLSKWCNSVKLENILEGGHYDMQQFWVCTIQDIVVKHHNIYEAVKQCNELAEKQSKIDVENITENLPF